MKNKVKAVLKVESNKMLGIVSFDTTEDIIRFCWIVNDKTETLRRAFLRFDKKGNMYFTSGKKRFYINEFTKV